MTAIYLIWDTKVHSLHGGEGDLHIQIFVNV